MNLKTIIDTLTDQILSNPQATESLSKPQSTESLSNPQETAQKQQRPIFVLNDTQKRAVAHIKKFIDDSDNNFLLMGGAGSGKTTVITSAFADSKFSIAFCAFTNKATQVLREASEKFATNFTADFFTIHKFLQLEPKYLERETEIAFKFDKNKRVHLKKYDIVFFDECSTISSELYDYLLQAREYAKFKYDKTVRYIFIGDYWQLPPVGEESSMVFDTAISERWKVSKLTKIMRSGNETMRNINNHLHEWIEVFRHPATEENKVFISYFHKQYPYNLVSRIEHPSIYLYQTDDLLDTYITTWQKNKINSVVILTYSRANCEKINFAIQDKLDINQERILPNIRTTDKFYVGDRCCIDKPVEICVISTLYEMSDGEYVTITNHSNESLYNGEIFDVVEAVDTKCKTPLNDRASNPKYFNCQVLGVKRINDSSNVVHYIIHIPKDIVELARQQLRKSMRRDQYLQIMTMFIKVFPKLDYGYCITVYKSQGSEWHTVLINLNSIKWCTVGDHRDPDNIIDMKKKKALFKTTYTAITRASHDLKLFWF